VCVCVCVGCMCGVCVCGVCMCVYVKALCIFVTASVVSPGQSSVDFSV